MMPASAATEALPWQPDPTELADFLRRRGLRVGTGDLLRALALLDRLRVLGRAPATPAEAAPLLAPILCTSKRHQEMLGPWLEDFAGSRVEPEIVKELKSPGPQPPSAPKRDRRLAIFLAVLLLAILIVGVRFRNLPIISAGTGVHPHTAASAEVAPSLHGFPSNLKRLLITGPFLLGPPLLLFAWIAVRGSRFPAMVRGAYAGGPVSRLRTGGDDEARFLFTGEAFREALKKLRQHRRVRSRLVDARLSVRATIAHAGEPRLMRASSVSAPEYPLVVQTLSSRDHLDYFAQVLSVRLAEGGVHHALYRFSADARFLWDGADAPTTLAELHGRYAGDVLLFLGDGAPMFDPITLTVRPWVADLADWRVVVLFTPLPRSRWSWVERRLAEAGLLVLPATSEGAALLGTFLAEGGRPPNLPLQRSPVRASLLTAEGVHASRFHTDNIPNPVEREEIYDAILQDVPPHAVDVLCMTALFPECRPDVLAHLGGVVRDRNFQLLDEEGFGALCTLPWLRYGRMPDWLRLGLVQALDKQREDEARTILQQWVGSAPDPRGILVSDPKGKLLAPVQRVQDMIYLCLVRNEDLSSLQLRAPNDLRRLAQDADRIRLRWPALLAAAAMLGIESYVTLFGSALISRVFSILNEPYQKGGFIVAAFVSVGMTEAALLMLIAAKAGTQARSPSISTQTRPTRSPRSDRATSVAIKGDRKAGLPSQTDNDPLIDRRPQYITPEEQRRASLLTEWSKTEALPNKIISAAFKAIQGSGSSEIIDLTRSLLDSPDITPHVFGIILGRLVDPKPLPRRPLLTAGRTLFLIDSIGVLLVWPQWLRFACWGSECFEATPDGLGAVLYPIITLASIIGMRLYRQDFLPPSRRSFSRLIFAVSGSCVATACVMALLAPWIGGPADRVRLFVGALVVFSVSAIASRLIFALARKTIAIANRIYRREIKFSKPK